MFRTKVMLRYRALADITDVAPSEALEEPYRPQSMALQEAQLITQLREEANAEAESFGSYAFQALGMSNIALGGVLYLMFWSGGVLAAGLAAFPILFFVLLTCQLGDTSYASANRHHGYELYLYRIRTIRRGSEGRWNHEYRSIEWEAAMRAWRIVQTTLYETVHRPGRYLRRDKYNKGFDPRKRPLWFSQLSLSGSSGAKPYAGAYLARMHAMLLLVAFVCVVILAATMVGVVVHPFLIPDKNLQFVSPDYLNFLAATVCTCAFIIGLTVFILRLRAEKARRRILEDGLLSIHSCAIVWQAVVVAHFNALKRARDCGLTSWHLVDIARKAKRDHHDDWKEWQKGAKPFEKLVALVLKDEGEPEEIDGAGLTGYTFWLGEEAASLARCAVDVPGWVGLGEAKLRRLGIVE